MRRFVPRSSDELDSADRFVHDATRAFAGGFPAPMTPTSDVWVDRAARAGVLLAVCSVVSRSGGTLPAATRAARVMHAAVQLAALHDAAWLDGVLADLKVPWAILKGPVLSHVVYATKDAREYSDVDVLVDPGDFAVVVRTLVSHGAELVAADWAHVTHHRTAEIGLVLPGGTLLDLHWSLINIGRIRDGFDGSLAGLLESRVIRDIGQFRLPTLGDHDLVLHVLLHASLSGAHRLRWLLDSQQCIRWLGGSVSGLGDRARVLGLGATTRVVLERAAQYVDDTLWSEAESSAPRSSWSAATRRVSSRLPPSAPSLGQSSGQVWLASTRPTAVASFRELSRATLAEVRYRRASRPQPDRVPARVDDAGLERWLRAAGSDARL